MKQTLIKALTVAVLAIICSTAMASQATFTAVSEVTFSGATETSPAFSLKQLELPDSQGILSALNSCRDSSGKTHLVVIDCISKSKIVLRYLREKDTAWEGCIIDSLGVTEEVPGSTPVMNIPNHRPAIAVGADGSVHFVYLKKAGKTTSICHSQLKPDATVSTSNIESIGEASMHQIGLLVTPENMAHISYYKNGVRYAENSGGTFKASTIKADDTGNNFLERGSVSEIIRTADGTLMVPYMGTHHRRNVVTAQFVDCVIFSDKTWKNTGVYGELGVLAGDSISACLNQSGTPTAFYTIGGVLGYATYEQGKWKRTTSGMVKKMGSGGMRALIKANGEEAVAWIDNESSLNLSTRKNAAAEWSHSSIGKFQSTMMIDQMRTPAVFANSNGSYDIFTSVFQPGKAVIIRATGK
jgi:hypothetical protein